MKKYLGVITVFGVLVALTLFIEQTDGYKSLLTGRGASYEQEETSLPRPEESQLISTDSSPDLPADTSSEIIESTPTGTITGTPTVTRTIVVSTPKPTTPATPRPTNTPVVTTPPATATPVPTIDYTKPWPVATSCPATTLACVPCTSGTYCRFEPGKTHGFLGWSCQNNNPGNIRNASTNMATDFKNLMIIRNGGTAACGVRYDVRGGSYFVFTSYTAGIGALKAYVKGINNGEHSAYTGCGNCTIAFFFSKYAPGDPNYASYVASYIGVSTSQTIRYVVENNKLDGFVEAIKIHEGFFVQ